MIASLIGEAETPRESSHLLVHSPNVALSQTEAEDNKLEMETQFRSAMWVTGTRGHKP